MHLGLKEKKHSMLAYPIKKKGETLSVAPGISRTQRKETLGSMER
jgi:hypothetical protein